MKHSVRVTSLYHESLRRDLLCTALSHLGISRERVLAVQRRDMASVPCASGSGWLQQHNAHNHDTKQGFRQPASTQIVTTAT